MEDAAGRGVGLVRQHAGADDEDRDGCGAQEAVGDVAEDALSGRSVDVGADEEAGRSFGADGCGDDLGCDTAFDDDGAGDAAGFDVVGGGFESVAGGGAVALATGCSTTAEPGVVRLRQGVNEAD